MFQNFIRTLIITFLFLVSSNVIANTNVEKYQKQVVKNLSNSSTDTLVWIRAFNNTYNKFCKSHETSRRYNLFFKVAAETIVDQLMDRGDWNASWQGKYGYRKSQLNSLKNRLGISGYCTCVFNHIIKGNSSCLKN